MPALLNLRSTINKNGILLILSIEPISLDGREGIMETCKSICGKDRCELPVGHKGKHREQGCTWTDGGAERVNAELAAEALKKFESK